MADGPAISVVIAAYDAAATIMGTLASLTAQTFADWEAIVVDDGSRDTTADLVSAAAARDPRIRLICRTNGGAGAARNSGLARARGAWTLFLDADDTIDRRHLARMIRRGDACPEVAAVCCGYRRVEADGAVLARYPAPRLDRDAIGGCRQRPPAALHAFLSRTAALRSLGGFDEGLRTNEDWDLWWRMARTGLAFGVERRILANYHVTAGSLTRDGRAMLCDTLAMQARISPGGDPAGAIEALMWNAGSMMAIGGDPRCLAGEVAPITGGVDIAQAAAALIDGMIVGAGLRPADLARGWSAREGAIAAFLGTLGLAGVAAVDVMALGDRIEREVIRMARFSGAIRVGRSVGVMLAPWHLLVAIRPVAGARRVVMRLPVLRPRSRFMVEVPLDRPLRPRRLLRCLAAGLLRG